MRTFLGLLVWLAVVICLPSRSAEAQIVSGIVVEESSGLGVSGVLILLVGEDNRTHARARSNESGHFMIRAPVGGSYTLRALRIGFRSAEAPIANLAQGETRALRVTASVKPVGLEAIRVDARAKCVVGPTEGMDTYRVWDEARKVLASTTLSQEERGFRVTLVKYRRVLDPESERVRLERRTRQTGLSERPFVSLPAAQLASHGYARRDSTGTWYFAPDAEVLLSEEFLRQHCFTLQRGAGSEEDLLGLTFTPATKTDRVDIAGTLWLHRPTSELRFLEYGYTGIPSTPAWRKLGGRVEFKRLPNNAWIVQRWAIRLPEINVVTSRFLPPAGGIPEERRNDVLVSLQEEGGEVLEVSAVDGSPLSTSERASLAGVVFDSTRGVPLPGARVFLSGTEHAAVTDSAGRFQLSGLSNGEFSVSFQHPRLDSIGMVGSSGIARLTHGHEAAVDLHVPSITTLLSRACPDSSLHAGVGMITGIVRDAQTGDPLAKARVVFAWSDSTVDRRSSRVRAVEATADAAGRYRACGAPAGISLVGRAVKEERSGPTSEIRITPREIARHDFLVARTLPEDAAVPPVTTEALAVVMRDSLSREPVSGGSALLFGVVRDLNGNPIPHASVRLAAREQWVPVDAGGGFRLDRVPLGRHTLDVRAFGYARERVTADLGESATYRVTVALSVAPALLAEMRIEAPRPRSFFSMSGFEERRKRGLGHFITRKQIEATGGARMSDALRLVPGVFLVPVCGGMSPDFVVQMQRGARGVPPNMRTPRVGGGQPDADAAVELPPEAERRQEGPCQSSPNAPTLGRLCKVAYYLNGEPLEPLDGVIDHEIGLNEVEAVEVYRGAQVPPRFAGAAFGCGVVAIWTRPPQPKK